MRKSGGIAVPGAEAVGDAPRLRLIAPPVAHLKHWAVAHISHIPALTSIAAAAPFQA